MQSKIHKYSDIVIEWIPYNQFIDVIEVGNDGFSTICSATWKDGPLYYNEYCLETGTEKYSRVLNKKVALKYIENATNIVTINEFLNEVRNFY